ncbi:MAG: hypothetical protein CMK09_04435 [Ponticaulis sp.]|nr:hypothetical protein [Ponticaulis sp.]|tara:strand:- start:29570 stop:29986 length:417 start_codon:yes stop_codon:yes gene_type:complete
MSYDFHVHRFEDWSEPTEKDAISFEEWIELCRADDELSEDGAYRDNRFDFDIPIFGWPAPEGEAASFLWLDGEIIVTSPDETAIIKAKKIAEKLVAKVQGDDGEFYGEDGKPDHTDSDANEQALQPKPPPFWRRLFGK